VIHQRHEQPATTSSRSQRVFELARLVGFDLCGVIPADFSAELEHLPEWLARGYAGEMKYLHDPRRANPAQVLEGAKNIIVVALNYNSSLPYSTQVSPAADDAPRGWISRYAWGDDYHHVLRAKLDQLIAALHAEFPQEFKARAYVDTGPILERAAAQAAGVGSVGKHTLLINEQLGSWLFLGVILTDLDLLEGSSMGAALPTSSAAASAPTDLCGNCTLCIDACPTHAIVEPYILDARRCISYLTIELRGAIPEDLRTQVGRMVYGCDICQDICPWNHKVPVSSLSSFHPRALPTASCHTTQNGESLFAPLLETLAGLLEDQYKEIFRGSPIKRAKWRGLIRNACVALGNAKLRPASEPFTRVTALLAKLADSPDSLISEHARWALQRLSIASPST
jgi:epoxyqueuosine reductase